LIDIMGIKALTFDVFGTVVDWRGSVIHEGKRLGSGLLVDVDWPAFADAWRQGYEPAMARVRTGELPWTKIDDLHRMILDRLLLEYGIEGLDEERKDYLNRVWHRLAPWPDAIDGLNRIRDRYVIAALSNGNVSLLTNMAKHAGLPWDCILSAELAKKYKPDREVYQTAVELLGFPSDQVMMVAAHKHDLDGAKMAGMRTAYVPRSLEFGTRHVVDVEPDDRYDMFAYDFNDLASKLGT